MKKLNETEMRQVEGGRWKCKTCGQVSVVYVSAIIHCMGNAHFNGSEKPGDWVKWVW